MVSEEIQNINRSDNSASLLPSEYERDATSGRMGENDPPEREGPLAQGLRGSTQPFARIDASAVQDAEDFVEAASSETEPMPSPTKSPSSAPTLSPPYNPYQPSLGGPLTNPGTPYQPSAMSASMFERVGNHSSTIASSNLLGAIEDRLSRVPMHNVLGPAASQQLLGATGRWLLRSDSKEKTSKKLATWQWLQGPEDDDKRIDSMAGLSPVQKGRMKMARKAKRAGLLVLKQSVGKKVVEEVVRGVYPKQDVLGQGEAVAALSRVRSALTMNSSYLGNDVSRVVAKVKSLLPAAQPGKSNDKPKVQAKA